MTTSLGTDRRAVSKLYRGFPSLPCGESAEGAVEGPSDELYAQVADGSFGAVPLLLGEEVAVVGAVTAVGTPQLEW
jgi:hypothetical protein